jgi:uncharacterized membrane protein YdjX (TVP38/TMEM64 family)
MRYKIAVFLRSLIRQWLNRVYYRLPRISPSRSLWFSLVFMAVPGLSYTLKNYALALSGVPFSHFFPSGYLVQGAMGVPFVIAGDAVADKSLLLVAAVVIVLLIIYGAVYLLRRTSDI